MKEQKQEVKENSQAIQAGRDVVIQNDYHQIKEICEDLYKLNFPELVDQASKKAKENLESYAGILVKSITDDDLKKIQEKLKTPQSQFLLNESIENAVRYGDGIDLELLSRAVKNAFLADTDFLETLFSEAANIIPKLNKEQLVLIEVNFFITILGMKEEEHLVTLLEAFALSVFLKRQPFKNVNRSQMMYLVSRGVFLFNQFAGGMSKDIFKLKYPQKYNTEILPALNSEKAPMLGKVSSYFDSNEMIKYHPTPIGTTIGYLITKESVPMLSIDILKSL